MKLIRYRRPSLKTVFGIKRELGMSQVQSWTKLIRVKQRAKYQLGYYSPTMRSIRQASQGNFPSIFVLFTKRKQ